MNTETTKAEDFWNIIKPTGWAEPYSYKKLLPYSEYIGDKAFSSYHKSSLILNALEYTLLKDHELFYEILKKHRDFVFKFNLNEDILIILLDSINNKEKTIDLDIIINTIKLLVDDYCLNINFKYNTEIKSLNKNENDFYATIGFATILFPVNLFFTLISLQRPEQKRTGRVRAHPTNINNSKIYDLLLNSVNINKKLSKQTPSLFEYLVYYREKEAINYIVENKIKFFLKKGYNCSFSDNVTNNKNNNNNGFSSSSSCYVKCNDLIGLIQKFDQHHNQRFKNEYSEILDILTMANTRKVLNKTIVKLKKSKQSINLIKRKKFL